MAIHPGKCCDGRCTGTKKVPARRTGIPEPEGTPGLTLECGEAVCLLRLRGRVAVVQGEVGLQKRGWAVGRARE